MYRWLVPWLGDPLPPGCAPVLSLSLPAECGMAPSVPSVAAAQKGLRSVDGRGLPALQSSSQLEAQASGSHSHGGMEPHDQAVWVQF